MGDMVADSTAKMVGVIPSLNFKLFLWKVINTAFHKALKYLQMP